MTTARGYLIQAVPLIEGQINVGTGTYTAKALIHCDTDAEITLPFSSGAYTYNLKAGDDRAYLGAFTVLSGTVTYE